MYRLYFKSKLDEFLNEEPLISPEKLTVGEKFSLSSSKDSVQMVVVDTERIFDCNDIKDGVTYYVTVRVNNNQIGFSIPQKESIIRDIKELNNAYIRQISMS